MARLAHRRTVAGLAVSAALAGCSFETREASTTTTATLPAGVTRVPADRGVADAEAAVKARPRSARALAELIAAHYRAAVADAHPVEHTYTEAGRKHLRLAARAWERYLALDPEPVDKLTAQKMTLIYGSPGLDEPRKALAAQRIVTQIERDSPSYARLALSAYEAGDRRTGDLAAARAVKLAPKRQRAQLRKALRDLRARKFP